MNPWLHKMLADARAEEMRRAASGRAHHRARFGPRGPRRLLAVFARAPQPERIPIEQTVTIRYAFADDAYALAKLAELDSSPQPAQPILLAEVDGTLWAALSMADGAVIADPFRRTRPLIELLAARAAQLSGSRSDRRRRVLAPPVWRAVMTDDDART